MTRKKNINYKLNDIISEYNVALYEEVLNKISIVLEMNNVFSWSASIVENQAVIKYCNSKYADACFAHELLHIKYELKGLKSPKIKDYEGVSNIMHIIFNQLCHHKFYGEFYDMGFIEEEFLNDNDSVQISRMADRDIKQLEGIYKVSGEIEGSIALLLPYITLISPHDKSDKTLKYIERLKNIGDNAFFDKIDLIIKEWTISNTLDSSLTFARLFNAANRFKIGFSLSGNEQDIIVAGNV